MRAKTSKRRTGLNDAMPDSPVERVRKSLPRGDGRWPGFDHVYLKIAAACEHMAQTVLRLSDEHVTAMAILGSGHEETMKAEMWRLRTRGFVT